MDYGRCIYTVLWCLYINVFTLSTHDTVGTSVCGTVFIHNVNVYCLYDCVWYYWPWCNIGQLALQYNYTWHNDGRFMCLGNGACSQPVQIATKIELKLANVPVQSAKKSCKIFA